MPSALARLELTDFRNYRRLEWDLRPGVTVLAGGNGAGKTSLLEAVHYLALLRSFRTRNLQELRRLDGSGFVLKARLPGGARIRSLQVSQLQERSLQADGVPLNRASDFINAFWVVAFIPEDLGLVKGPGSDRRRFLDILGSQLAPGYLRILGEYHEVLRQRNAVLRQHVRFGDRALAAFDQRLAVLGGAVIHHRLIVMDELCPELEAAGHGFFAGAQLTARYQAGTGPETATPEALAGRLLELLEKNRERDLRDGVTQAGPHRDDLPLMLDGRLLSAYGSEGQCRAAALALRLASYRVLSKHVGPGQGLILLIDDVLGELDAFRRRAFLSGLQDCPQALLTVTDPAEYAAWAGGQVVTVCGGVLN